MAKTQDIRARFGSNLAESLGANRPAGPAASDAPVPDRFDGTDRLEAAATIEVDRIIPDPDQPRKDFDPEALDRLAASLADHGQIQPITVRWSEAVGRYLIVTGERRWRASVKAGRPTIAAVIAEVDRTESQILELQLIENCLREDLLPVEQARAFRTLMDRNGWTATRLARTLHMSEAAIGKALALLSLPEPIQSQVESGAIAPSVAYELTRLDDPEAQRDVASRVVGEKLTRAETIEAVKKAASRPRGTSSKGRGAKPRKVTERAFKTEGGTRLTLENRRGLDDASIRAALLEVLAQIPAETSDDQVAA
jgi:ParB family transcriptional regulator, chromosome partitioning protein